MCPICDSPTAKKATGPRSTYCSPRCRRRADYLRRRDRTLATRRAESAAARADATKTCPLCSATFQPEKSMRQTYCSTRCASAAGRDASARVCSEDGCDRPVRARGICAKHWRRQARAEGREAPEPWSARRRESHQRRRALKIGASAERIANADVFERDGWSCGICCEPVNPLAAWPDRMSPSLDHIVPLSKGGAHTYANVQLAHLGCNVEKGARVPA